VHEIDGWDDLRRRLQPDRRCFAFFHPQLPDEPLIFVEVALLPEMPAAIAPLIDKSSTPQPSERFRVAAFYSISNCEPGLRNVSLGNFLIKSVAEQLQRELPRIKTFCTLSPIPGFAAWLLGEPDFHAAQPAAPCRGRFRRRARASAQAVRRRSGRAAARRHARQAGPGIDRGAADAVLGLPAAPVAHARRRPGGALSTSTMARGWSGSTAWQHVGQGLKQSFGMMVNYLYDLDKIEASHEKFKQGEVARSRAVHTVM
jgi:malonyl-CoA decarboxylase